MILHFTYESSVFFIVTTITKLNLGQGETELNKKTRNNIEFGHFTLLFAEDSKEMYQ